MTLLLLSCQRSQQNTLIVILYCNDKKSIKYYEIENHGLTCLCAKHTGRRPWFYLPVGRQVARNNKKPPVVTNGIDALFPLNSCRRLVGYQEGNSTDLRYFIGHSATYMLHEIPRKFN